MFDFLCDMLFTEINAAANVSSGMLNSNVHIIAPKLLLMFHLLVILNRFCGVQISSCVFAFIYSFILYYFCISFNISV